MLTTDEARRAVKLGAILRDTTDDEDGMAVEFADDDPAKETEIVQLARSDFRRWVDTLDLEWVERHCGRAEADAHDSHDWPDTHKGGSYRCPGRQPIEAHHATADESCTVPSCEVC